MKDGVFRLTDDPVTYINTRCVNLYLPMASYLKPFFSLKVSAFIFVLPTHCLCICIVPFSANSLTCISIIKGHTIRVFVLCLFVCQFQTVCSVQIIILYLISQLKIYSKRKIASQMQNHGRSLRRRLTKKRYQIVPIVPLFSTEHKQGNSGAF